MNDTTRNVDLGLQCKTTSDIRECISELKEDFARNGCPIRDDNKSLYRFCSKLELLLQFGLKEKFKFSSEKCDYFSFMSECLKDNRSLKDGIRFVKQHKEYQTKLSQGRALIRYSLVKHLLADTLQHCVSYANAKVIGKWYTKQSFFNQQLVQQLISDLYDLNEIDFDLDPSVSDLDVGWPTFSRYTNSPSHPWSINSLMMTSRASIASSYQDDCNSLFSCGGNHGNDAVKNFNEGEIGMKEEEEEEEDAAMMDRVEREREDRTSQQDDSYVDDSKSVHLRIKELTDIFGEPGGQMPGQQFLELCPEKLRFLQKLNAEPKFMEELQEELKGLKEELGNAEFNESEMERLSSSRRELMTENERLREKLVAMDRDKLQADCVIGELVSKVSRGEQEVEQTRLENTVQLEKLGADMKLLLEFLERMQCLCFQNCSEPGSPESTCISESFLDRLLARLEELSEFHVKHSGRKVESSAGDAENLKISMAELEIESLKGQLEEKSREVKTLMTDLEEVEEALASAEREKGEISERMKEETKEKDEAVKDLKDDMEIMIGSFKRREILIEEARRSFEKSMERILEEHSGEVSSYKENIKHLESKISREMTPEKKLELEESISRLEESLMTAKEEIIIMREQHSEGINEANKHLESMEVENMSLRNQVSQLVRDLRMEQGLWRGREGEWLAKQTDLEKKNAILKNNFAQLLNNKRELWEKCQEMKEKEEVSASHKWVDSSTVNHCSLCNVPFSIYVRKHHCRKCGNVSCANCCNNWMDTPHSGKKSRVCNHCKEMMDLEKKETEQETVDLRPRCELDYSHRMLDASSTSSDSFLEAEPGVDSLLPPEVCVPYYVQTSAPSGGLSTLARWTGGVKNAAVWATSTAVSSIVKTTGQVSGIFGKGTVPLDAGDSESQLGVYDDRFEILSPEEITESRISVISNDEVIILDVLDPAKGEDSFQMIHEIPQQKLLVIPVHLGFDADKATSLIWSFHSEPTGITFGISYHGPYDRDAHSSQPEMSASATQTTMKSSLSSSMYLPFSGGMSSSMCEASTTVHKQSEILLSLKKVHSHMKNVSGSLVPKNAGIYAFIFDNTRSSLNTKKVFLHLKLVPCSAIPPPSDC